jgi:hypothetical protein
VLEQAQGTPSSDNLFLNGRMAGKEQDFINNVRHGDVTGSTQLLKEGVDVNFGTQVF